ncbi:CBS domain-containing protein [Actinokineospora auranticolor]|uniref:BON domain-containing protein n=1 Tax=Actinokineospora auranticolor TaxID=155976 RepID=A0A2S6H0E3_9PSEU|nr:CBS domain-containing protein [Actinokineospora auranticolor]PPK70943.1 BON domain-containing protein [Actinokineospora auranticolor]
MRHHTIAEVMSRDPATARVDTGFAELVRLMAARSVSALPVLDEDGRVLGVVSEADLLAKESVQERPHAISALLRRHAERVRARGTTAGELMSSPAVTIAPEATIPHGARMMVDRRVKLLPVIDPDARLLGVVSRSDLLKMFSRPDSEILTEIADEVFMRGLGIGTEGVRITLAGGIVTLEGRVERRSWATVADALTRQIDGVVDVHTLLDYDWDDAAITIPEAMVVDITHEPRR